MYHGHPHGYAADTRDAATVRLRRPAAAEATAGRRGAAPDPIFVDRTGRRRRLFASAGTACGLLLALAMLAMFAGITVGTPRALPGLPGAGADRTVARVKAGRSHTAPTAATRPRTTAPAAAATASATPDPSGTPSATASATPDGNPHRRVPSHTPTARGKKK
ncbi:hypothetical protein EV385_4909 [Krasilnikovia cinnamomea]|uniref:Uncharacterized protein n=1 Tax=Krasilnikovia cinnamomea TaxID=349313 RepID=A0A4Q7ZRC5_9ACTN|nr:hypothetical protein [Krasilnikovia cinnamomea]RZU53025.1 hypothetical protein EV385_4909 [Krasilnikovia cinnamomea]